MNSGRDSIVLRDMDLPCRIGVAPGEADVAQPLRVGLRVELDLEPAARSGLLEDTLDYARLAERAQELVAGRSWTLLESLARALLSAALVEPRVSAAEVEIEKRRPPLGTAVGPIAVRMRRTRGEDVNEELP